MYVVHNLRHNYFFRKLKQRVSFTPTLIDVNARNYTQRKLTILLLWQWEIEN